MKRTNRTCVVCGKKYFYCPSCDDKLRPSWYGMFHNENCKIVFNTLTDHFLKKVSSIDAYEVLKKCDLSEMHLFSPESQEQIRNIFSDVESEKNIQRKQSRKKSNMVDDASADNTSVRSETKSNCE